MPKGKPLTFNDKELAFFDQTRHLTYGEVTAQLAEKFGRTLSQSSLRHWLSRSGYNRSFDTNNGKFKKGHKPWNKGVKGYRPSPETIWKKGHGCWWKARELGAERINRYGNVEVKVSMTRSENGISRKMWHFRSHLVWEKYTGEVPPKGMIVLHLNSDPADDRIENLALVTQRENLALIKHGFHKLPPDLNIRQAMLTLVKFDIKRREFDEKHGLYKKYVDPKKAKSTCTTQTGTQESNERS